MTVFVAVRWSLAQYAPYDFGIYISLDERTVARTSRLGNEVSITFRSTPMYWFPVIMMGETLPIAVTQDRF